MRESPVPSDRSARQRPGSLVVALLFALLLAAGAAPAFSADLEILPEAPISKLAIDGPTLAQKFQAAYWRGRTCNTPACKAGRPSSIAHVASFGVAAFGGILISRRRDD